MNAKGLGSSEMNVRNWRKTDPIRLYLEERRKDSCAHENNMMNSFMNKGNKQMFL